MNLEKQKIRNGMIVKLMDDTLNYKQADMFRENLLKLGSEGHRTILLNLEKLNLIDSSGIGTLISFWKTFGSAVTLKLYAIQPHIKKYFMTTSLDKLFDIYDTEKEVIASIKH